MKPVSDYILFIDLNKSLNAKEFCELCAKTIEAGERTIFDLYSKLDLTINRIPQNYIEQLDKFLFRLCFGENISGRAESLAWQHIFNYYDTFGAAKDLVIKYFEFILFCSNCVSLISEKQLISEKIPKLTYTFFRPGASFNPHNNRLLIYLIDIKSAFVEGNSIKFDFKLPSFEAWMMDARQVRTTENLLEKQIEIDIYTGKNQWNKTLSIDTALGGITKNWLIKTLDDLT